MRWTLACVMLLATATIARTDLPEIAVGKPFPVIELPTLDGESASIASFRGRRVMLHVFASW